MQSKKPKIIETVGALYYAFNTPNESDGSYDSSTYEDIVKSPIIKKVSIEPESDNTVIRASGQDYDEVNQTSSIGIEIETVAFDPGDLAKAKGENISNKGLISGGSSTTRPFLAIGYPVIKKDGAKAFKWYPKCKLTENKEEVSTSEKSFSEQNPTEKFTAYSFNDKNEKYVYVDTETSCFPEGLTEDLFFSKVITCDDDIEEILPTTPTA